MTAPHSCDILSPASAGLKAHHVIAQPGGLGRIALNFSRSVGPEQNRWKKPSRMLDKFCQQHGPRPAPAESALPNLRTTPKIRGNKVEQGSTMRKMNFINAMDRPLTSPLIPLRSPGSGEGNYWEYAKPTVETVGYYRSPPHGFRNAFSAFEFVAIRAIRVRPF